ncbi:MAG: hypothetical protein M3352_04095 [Bacteroidota bacterium]|nr:hypothetical protein [Bacteroidota bacterium]
MEIHFCGSTGGLVAVQGDSGGKADRFSAAGLSFVAGWLQAIITVNNEHKKWQVFVAAGGGS